MIHKDLNGKPKCGARSWRGGFSLGMALSPDDKDVNCKRCNGTGKKPQEAFDLPRNYVGKILHYSWGYDMTINEFYLIISQGKRSVVGVKIGTKTVDGAGGFTGREMPNPDVRTDKQVRFLAKTKPWIDGGVAFIGDGRRYATLFDGKPTYFNTLD